MSRSEGYDAESPFSGYSVHVKSVLLKISHSDIAYSIKHGKANWLFQTCYFLEPFHI